MTLQEVFFSISKFETILKLRLATLVAEMLLFTPFFAVLWNIFEFMPKKLASSHIPFVHLLYFLRWRFLFQTNVWAIYAEYKTKVGNRLAVCDQSDRIGRIIAYWVIVYIWAVVKKNSTHFKATFYKVKVMMIVKIGWATFGPPFRKTIWSPCDNDPPKLGLCIRTYAGFCYRFRHQRQLNWTHSVTCLSILLTLVSAQHLSA
jgi:hypothetical protein